MVQRDREIVAEEQFKSGNQHALTNPDGEIVKKKIFLKCKFEIQVGNDRGGDSQGFVNNFIEKNQTFKEEQGDKKNCVLTSLV